MSPSRKYPSLQLALESKDPKPFDIVGWFGSIPVNRVTADTADEMIAGSAKLLAELDRDVVSEVLLATNGIGFVVGPKTSRNPSRHDDLEGNPYVISLELPIATCELAAMLSTPGGDVHRPFRDLLIACFGLCGLNPDEIMDNSISMLHELRQQFAHAFATALVGWYDARAKEF